MFQSKKGNVVYVVYEWKTIFPICRNFQSGPTVVASIRKALKEKIKHNEIFLLRQKMKHRLNSQRLSTITYIQYCQGRCTEFLASFFGGTTKASVIGMTPREIYSLLLLLSYLALSRKKTENFFNKEEEDMGKFSFKHQKETSSPRKSRSVTNSDDAFP